MSESSPELDALRKVVAAQRQDALAEDESKVYRLARAIAAEPGSDWALCRHCRQMLPQLAEAELCHENIARRFPDVVAHLDTCTDCALEYAELLDALLDLDKGLSAEETLPGFPDRLRMALRLHGWVKGVAQQIAAALDLAEPAGFETAARALLERLPQWSELPAPRRIQQMALGWGTDAQVVQLVLATWITTEHLIQHHTEQELRELAATGRLADVARGAAKETARRMKLGRLGPRFSEQYAAQVSMVADDLAALAAQE